jgi:hypothetical protein
VQVPMSLWRSTQRQYNWTQWSRWSSSSSSPRETGPDRGCCISWIYVAFDDALLFRRATAT